MNTIIFIIGPADKWVFNSWNITLQSSKIKKSTLRWLISTEEKRRKEYQKCQKKSGEYRKKSHAVVSVNRLAADMSNSTFTTGNRHFFYQNKLYLAKWSVLYFLSLGFFRIK